MIRNTMRSRSLFFLLGVVMSIPLNIEAGNLKEAANFASEAEIKNYSPYQASWGDEWYTLSFLFPSAWSNTDRTYTDFLDLASDKLADGKLNADGEFTKFPNIDNTGLIGEG